MDRYLKEHFNYKNIKEDLRDFYSKTETIVLKKFKTFCYSLVGERSKLRINFWVRRGYSQEEATAEISKLQSKKFI